jgi:hypothetical protein
MLYVMFSKSHFGECGFGGKIHSILDHAGVPKWSGRRLHFVGNFRVKKQKGPFGYGKTQTMVADSEPYSQSVANFGSIFFPRWHPNVWTASAGMGVSKKNRVCKKNN